MIVSESQAQVSRLYAPRNLKFDAIELDAVTSDGFLARTRFSAISTGTELAAWSGAPPLHPDRSSYPRLMGYMNVAEVIQVGSDTSGIAPGDLVYTHQSHRSAFVVSQNAALAKLPPSFSSHVISPAYLYRLAWSALRRGGIKSDMKVAVVGLGVIGLATVQLARLLGAEVSAFSHRREAQEKALECGARAAQGIEAQDVLAEWQGLADLVVTTSNRWNDWRLAMELTRQNGQIAVLGFPGRGQPTPDINPLDSSLFYEKQLSVIAARIGILPGVEHSRDEEQQSMRQDMVQIVQWIVEGDLDSSKLVHAVRPWSELPEIYGELEHGAPPGVIVLDWT